MEQDGRLKDYSSTFSHGSKCERACCHPTISRCQSTYNFTVKRWARQPGSDQGKGPRRRTDVFATAAARKPPEMSVITGPYSSSHSSATNCYCEGDITASKRARWSAATTPQTLPASPRQCVSPKTACFSERSAVKAYSNTRATQNHRIVLTLLCAGLLLLVARGAAGAVFYRDGCQVAGPARVRTDGSALRRCYYGGVRRLCGLAGSGGRSHPGPGFAVPSAVSAG